MMIKAVPPFALAMNTVASCCFLISPTVFSDDHNQTLETVTVIGHAKSLKTELNGVKLDTLPINSMTLTQDEIERIRFINPDELLDRIPGESQVRNFRIPNGGKSYTLAFLDGLPIESPYEGATQRFNRTNMQDIAQIQVFKGPVSALLPNNLLGGAINVISKDTASSRNSELWLEQGSYDRTRFGLNQSGPIVKNKLSYFFDINKQDYSGMRDQAKDDRDQFSGKLRYNISNSHTLDIRAEYFAEDTIVRSDLTTDEIKQDQKQAKGVSSATDLKQKTLSLNHIQDYNWGMIQTSLLKRNKATVGLSRFRGPQDSEIDSTQAQIISRYNFNRSTDDNSHNIVFGVSYYSDDKNTKQYQRGDNQLTGKFEVTDSGLSITSAYLQHQISLTTKLALTSGIRYENIQLESQNKTKSSVKLAHDFSKAAPKLGLTYQLDATNQIWFGAGQGFYAPQISHLYEKNGNPSLKPEEANHLELGFRGNYNDWHYNTSLYHQIISNYLVTQEFLENGVDIERTTNAGKVKVRGVESVIEYAPHDRIWRLALTHTYAKNNYIKFNSAKGDFSGNEMARSPKQHFNIRFALEPISDLLVELETDLYSTYYSDDNNSNAGRFKRDERVNLRLNYTHNQWAYWLNANNLTDTVEDRASYRVRKGVGKMTFRTADGRNLVAGASYHF